MSVTSALKKFWRFVWESNSIWSWTVAFLLVFVFIFLIFFPVLRLILATPLPMVVIESGSMHHSYAFDQWYQSCNWYSEHGITQDELKKWEYNNGLDKGDIMIVQGQNEYKPGDIIVFKTTTAKPIIHRVVFADETNSKFSTKGDNNCYQLPQELNINKAQIIGKAVARIPYIGWAKVIWTDMFNAFKNAKTQ